VRSSLILHYDSPFHTQVKISRDSNVYVEITGVLVSPQMVYIYITLNTLPSALLRSVLALNLLSPSHPVIPFSS
jgi:hypothetical protein